ncbi:MAG: hypothetical protein KGI54_15835 [Pseudomonadota bacterium]|nr:hypothetical protein [Pseudomonadota bacterium]
MRPEKDLFNNQFTLPDTQPPMGMRVMWTEPVYESMPGWSYKLKIGTRQVLGIVIEHQGKTSFSVEVLASEGTQPYQKGEIVRTRGLCKRREVWQMQPDENFSYLRKEVFNP